MHVVKSGKAVLVNPGAVSGAYSTGDVVGTLQKITDAVLYTKGLAILRTLIVLDKDNQKKACDILFFDSAVTIAADNAPLTLSDTDLESLIGFVSVADVDYVTLEIGGNAIASKSVELLLPAAAKVRDIWVAVVSRGAPTYSTDGLKVKTMLEQF